MFVYRGFSFCHLFTDRTKLPKLNSDQPRTSAVKWRRETKSCRYSLSCSISYPTVIRINILGKLSNRSRLGTEESFRIVPRESSRGAVDFETQAEAHESVRSNLHKTVSASEQ